MRILAIRGARLASLDAPFEIDLGSEPLRSAGVFAITGPTGAGKSTLLDALCLALFADTPRLARTPGHRLEGGSGDRTLSADDPRTLVRDGAPSGYAEVDFVGVDGRVHRARWATSRARNGRLRAATLSLLDVASRQLVAGGKREVLLAIEARLGLGFAQLRRSVILPQNEFAAFLEADAEDRASLLERATGAEIFGEVARVVHERAVAARRARELASVALDALALLPADLVADAEARFTSERIASAQAEEQLAGLVRRRERLDALHVLRNEEREAVDAERAIEGQLALAETARAELALLDQLAPALIPLGDVRRTEEEVRLARVALESAESAAEDARASAVLDRETHAAACARLAGTRLVLAAERQRSTRVRELDEALALEAASLALERAAQADNERTLRELDTSAVAVLGIPADGAIPGDAVARAGDLIRQRLEGLERADVDGARRLEAWRASAAAAEASLLALPRVDVAAREALSEVVGALSGMRELASRRDALTLEAAAEEELALASLARADTHDASLTELEASVRVLEGQVGEAARAHERVLAALSLEGHRASLVPGEPCPLCGSLAHPRPNDAATAIELEARARALEVTRSLEATRAARESARGERSVHRSTAEAARVRAVRWAAEAKALQEPLAAAAARLIDLAAPLRAPESDGGALGREVVAWAHRAVSGSIAVDEVVALHARATTQRTASLEAEQRVAVAEAALGAARRSLSMEEAAQHAARLERAELHARVRAVGELASRVADARARDAARSPHRARLASRVAALEVDRRALVSGGDPDLTLRAAEQAVEGELAHVVAARDAEVRSAERAARASVDAAEAGARGERARQAAEVAQRALLSALSASARLGSLAGVAATSFDRATAERLLDAERESLARQRSELGRLDADRASLRARREERESKRREWESALAREGGEAGEALDRSITRARERRDAARLVEAETRRVLEQDRIGRASAGARAMEHARCVGEESRWRTLAEVVGAADGKRFRVYAQGLTLDRLLVFTNAQLLELAPRYRLARTRAATRASESLGLAIFDREGLDVPRSVRSLSGGESFLVSLALALGLSEMTSATATLGSLFIDEGFGALDPESTELAVSALESLRASGRQVAIVTHVPAIAERFAARVEVVPAGGGRSTVRIVGT